MTSPDLFDPILPYAGTSGHSGTDTSERRARVEDTDGTTTARQSETLRRLAETGSHGMTWHDLADLAGWHHGQASGVLSVLHRAGLISRLSISRNRCKVYVLPMFVDGRATEEPSTRPRRPVVPDGSLAMVLPAMIVEKLARGLAGSTITLPPGVADQLRAAAREAVEFGSDE